MSSCRTRPVSHRGGARLGGVVRPLREVLRTSSDTWARGTPEWLPWYVTLPVITWAATSVVTMAAAEGGAPCVISMSLIRIHQDLVFRIRG